MQRRLSLIGLATLATLAAEIAVFALVVRLLGLAWTLLLVLAVMALGGWLLLREGSRGWRRLRAATAGGQPAGREATEGLVGLFGGLLLAAPGFVTSAVGAVLLTPVGRRYAGQRVERVLERWISPALAGNLFGPRRVRVRRDRPAAAGSTSAGPAAAGRNSDLPPPGPASKVLEGEIVDLPRADPR